MTVDRRTFIKSALIGAGATAVGASSAHAASDYLNITRPSATLRGGYKAKSNIDNVVVVMMENRSTDHFVGWWGETEGVDFNGRTTLSPTASKAPTNWGATGDPTFAQHRNYTGHGFGDPNHSHNGGRFQILDHDGDGVPDGWNTPGSGADLFSLSYYTGTDLPVIDRLVRDYTAFDNYHCSWMGNTYPNRYYMHSAQTHGITNNNFPPQFAAEKPDWAAGFDWPTIWDFLTLRGVTWKYYYSNLPAIALFGARNLSNTRHITEYYADAAAGTLPQVSFVDPFFVAPEGLANDDHPHADIRLGQEFYSDVITSYMRSKHYATGAMFITYDEWGGFWDHVTPPNVGTSVDPLATTSPSDDYTAITIDSNNDGVNDRNEFTTASPADFGLYGFRVPTFLISPYAKATGDFGRTNKTRHDHTTILQFISENWGLPTPGQWDPGFSRRPAASMMEAFDPSVMDPTAKVDLDVDVDAYEYEAPPEAREDPYGANPASSVSELWGAADWIESLGYNIHTRFADALPYTRR